jgi:hypothetical protein
MCVPSHYKTVVFIGPSGGTWSKVHYCPQTTTTFLKHELYNRVIIVPQPPSSYADTQLFPLITLIGGPRMALLRAHNKYGCVYCIRGLCLKEPSHLLMALAVMACSEGFSVSEVLSLMVVGDFWALVFTGRLSMSTKSLSSNVSSHL